MALDTYSGLKAALQTWMARADLTNDIDTCIDLFEAWANRNLRVQQMEVEATTSAQEYLPLPTDFNELRDIEYLSVPKVELEYMTPPLGDIVDPYNQPGIPQFYTIVGGQLRLIPAPNDTVNVRIAYWQRIPALSDSNTTNWLLTEHPDAYLYGSLVHGNVRIKNGEAAAQVSQGWQAVMADLDAAGRRKNFGSLLRVRVARTP